MPLPGSTGFMSARAFGFTATAPVSNVISYLDISESSTSSISAPAGIASGDFAVIFNQAANFSAVTPTDVTPSGFTAIGTSQTATSGLTISLRWSMWYKVLAGSETSLSVMSAASMYSSMVVFRKTTGTWGTPSSVGNEANLSGIASKTVTVGTAPLVIIGATPGSPISMSPAGTYVGAGLDNGYLIYQSGASNNTVDDSSPSVLSIGCFYVAVT